MLRYIAKAMITGLVFALVMPAAAAAETDESAMAQARASEDEEALERGFEAMTAHDYKAAVSEFSAVINRFEQRQADKTDYYCATGAADNLSILIGAAISDSGDEGGISSTVAPAICAAYFLKGFALIDLGKSKEALPYLQTAVEMDSYNQHYLNELAEWYKVDRNWKKSLELFTQASEMGQKGDDAAWPDMQCRSLRGIGFNQIELGDLEAAHDAFDACLDIIPDDPGSLGEIEYMMHLKTASD